MPRICIYTADIVAMTGVSENTARRMLKRIREELDKPKWAPVTVKEFCAQTKIREEEVEPFLEKAS